MLLRLILGFFIPFLLVVFTLSASVRIGNWAQPGNPESLNKWGKDGATVWIHPEATGKFTKMGVRKAIAERGAFYIDKPIGSSPEELQKDADYLISDPACLFLSAFKDEPDLHLPPSNSNKAGYDKYIAEQMAIDGWIAPYVAGRKPLQITFAGPKVTGGLDSGYSGLQQKPWVDYIAKYPPKVGKHLLLSDWYPSNQNRARYPDTFPALAVKSLRKWFGDTFFEYGSFLEISDQMLDKNPGEFPGRAPKPEEVEAQLKAVLDEKVVMIAWFSHQFMGQAWDPIEDRNAWDGSDEGLRAKRKDIAFRLNPSVSPSPTPHPLEERIKQLELQVLELKKNSITAIEVKRGE